MPGPATVSAFDGLQALAARQLEDGNPLQAIKCLEASLQLSPMPAEDAQVRLRVARLLLQHTSNLSEAKQHLQKAVCGVAPRLRLLCCTSYAPACLHAAASGHSPAVPHPKLPL
jgi:hypothetical protein